MSLAELMVIPEREIPAKSAAACANPRMIAFVLFIFKEILVANLIRNRNNAETKKPAPTEGRYSDKAEISLFIVRPKNAAGSVPINTKKIKR